jgi:predicted acylesterase/phospholipase RssA
VDIDKKYLFTDGGLLDNFPISKFDPDVTLGIRSTWYIDPSDPMNDISSYYTRVLSIMQLTMHSIQQQITEKYKNIILIDLGHIMAYNTNVNQKDLIFKGYRSAIASFSGLINQQTENPVKFLNSGGPLRLPAYLEDFRHA